MSHFGSLRLVPEAEKDDGLLYVVALRRSAGLLALWRFMRRGVRAGDKHVEVRACRAFRLEPTEGRVVVDGRSFGCAAIQGRVVSSGASVIGDGAGQRAALTRENSSAIVQMQSVVFGEIG